MPLPKSDINQQFTITYHYSKPMLVANISKLLA